jgi:hypothetical protein
VRVFLNDSAAGPQVFGPEWGGRPAERWPKTRESVVNNKVVRLADIAGDVENKEGSPLGCVHLSFKFVEPPGAPTWPLRGPAGARVRWSGSQLSGPRQLRESVELSPN